MLQCKYKYKYLSFFYAMCIFYTKSLHCGCVILACHFRREGNTIILSGHTYKRFCDKCLDLSDNELDNRLNEFKKHDYKLYSKEDSVLYSNGWKNTINNDFPIRDFDISTDIDCV